MAYEYFIYGDCPDDAELGKMTGLFRLRVGDPLMLAEALTVEGSWSRDDQLFRYRMLGSTDTDFHETTPERAERIISSWVANGRIKRFPSPGQDDRPDEETVEKMKALQARAEDIWASVPRPKGADQVGLS